MAGPRLNPADFEHLAKHWTDAMAHVRVHLPGGAAGASGTSLRRVSDFGSNPGALEMFVHRPERLAENPALVVALHGCGQNAASFDTGSGWSTLADRYGFVLLLPQQPHGNNPQGCFNWYRPGDTARGGGEVLSIRQMIARAAADAGIAPDRVFVTGLSAGGAMTAAMLATYPETFAGGAIVAGLPYGAATNVKEALDIMANVRSRPARDRGNAVRAASPHRGPWPTVSVWHGAADTVVGAHNAVELVKQWTDVHGVAPTPDLYDTVDGFPREVWRDGSGRAVVESWTVAGMGHGTPLAAGTGADQCGTAGAFMLDVGISSSYHIAKFWGLTGARIEQPKAAATAEPEIIPPGATGRPGPDSGSAPDGDDVWWKPGRFTSPDTLANDVMGVINKALKTAGLSR